jgi:amino acid adenylation domain-containing protein
MTEYADHLTLPTAWRALDADPTAGAAFEAAVRHADLAEGLQTLAAAVGTGTTAVLAAAHVKVLSMLAEAGAFRTDAVLTPNDPAVRVLSAERAEGTWAQLTGRVAATLRDTPPQATEHTDADGEAEGSLYPDRVLFVADPAWPGPAADRYGLSVHVGDGELTLRTARHAITRGFLDRLAAMYRSVLESMAADPGGDAAAARLPESDRDAVLSRWAAGPRVPWGAETALDLFRAQAARTPDAVAVRVHGLRLTYAELELRSSLIARHLLRLGTRPGVPIGICLRRTPDLLPVLLAIWQVGAPYLPLDADLPATRLRRMVCAAGCGLVVTGTEHLETLGGPGELGGAQILDLDRERAAIEAPPEDEGENEGEAGAGVRPGPADLAYIIYTSGSTGDPKGVMVHHGGLANYLRWTADAYAARGSGGSPFFTSIGFDLGVPSLFAPLLVGQAVDLLPDPLDPADLSALLAAGAPYSFVKMTPGHLNLLSLDLTPGQAAGLAGLAIAAGDAFPAELAARWLKLAGPGGTAVATEYGPTEITVGNSGQPVADPELHPAGLIPLGAPIPNTTAYLLDERLEPVPVGVPGEVCVGGAGVAHGYLGAPALTAERFVPDPYGPPGARLYRTGDRARWRESGEQEFLGRTDHQVKIRGYRVEVGEVRQALRRQAGVADAVVLAYERPPGPPRLAAFVVPATGADPDTRRLRAALAGELPEYMIPSDVVAVDEIPLTANGKADTRALRDRL